MTKALFITGNQNKADYLIRLLDMPIEHKKIDLDEIQSLSLEEVTKHKVRQAYEVVRRPVLVEDAGLSFHALNGLPGPFIKFFGETDEQLEVLCRTLDSFEDKRAIGSCMYGYYDGRETVMFVGSIEGTIADHPRGNNGFGWDKIFCPKGYDGKTRAELNGIEYEKVYLQIKPIEALGEFLRAKL